jgi:photosystem II stability/assembly factor-like uncharacterized protein
VWYCHATNTAYNDVYAGFYVSDSGYIHEEVMSGDDCFANLVFQVPGFPDLNSIDGYIVVGNAGTIVGGYPIWRVINSPTTQNLRSVCSHDLTIYYAVGDSGTVIKSTDGGSSWLLLQSPTSANLYSVECWSDGNVQIYGEGFTGYRSMDGGATWTKIDFYGLKSLEEPATTLEGNDLYTSFFIDQSTGYVCGAFGIVLQTTDAGSTWQIRFAPSFNRINTAYFVSVDSGVVAGDNGTIRFTTDGGQSWFEDSFASGLTIQDINHIEVNETDSVAVIVGDSGTVILVATDSTLLDARDVESLVPREYHLYQNYPNPFNPSTTISYDLPTLSVVELKVFDVLGKEVATLVNEKQNPGRRHAIFDGSGLASGVYLYRLTSEGFTAARKLVLIK